MKFWRRLTASVYSGLTSMARLEPGPLSAYSHSRRGQSILGGLTRHVLDCGVLPVLMGR